MVARLLLLLIMSAGVLFSQPYPDQHFFYEKEGLVKKVSSLNGLQVGKDGKSIILSEGVLSGTALFEPDSSQYPFNDGLPSWNGLVQDETNTGFRVLIRFYSNSTGWSTWLTAGYWKNNIWSSYGSTTFAGGKIDIDEVILTSYFTKWQFQVEMMRTSVSQPSPTLRKLSFFVSDKATTSAVSIPTVVNDKPEAIFIDTQHFYQYSLDPVIGGSICSPTSTSMAIRSYNILVDPLQFAKDNYDPKWGIYGVWPRTVENAAKYGLNGSVTRYRTWSDARKILAAGGRVVMSVGSPLYPSGHLIMLAGFDANGNPICHDPAKSNGYKYMWDKTSLSQSWFAKGGVAYTFYKEDSVNTTSVAMDEQAGVVKDFHVSNYPNPFNMQTTVRIETPVNGYTTIKAYDISGREVDNIFEGNLNSGTHIFRWNPAFLPTGNYFIHVVSGSYAKTIKSVLLK